MVKRLLTRLIILSTILTCFAWGGGRVFAHDAMLDVIYDDCVNDESGDGINETWYTLEQGDFYMHLDDDIDTVMYYFEDDPDGATWAECLSPSRIIEVQEAYASSMEKWNHVYFYTTDASGNIVKNKLINVVEGTEKTHNLSIYPMKNALSATVAATSHELRVEDLPCENGHHYHYSQWSMTVNVIYYYIHDSYNEDHVTAVQEWAGAHELGHVLGLTDTDVNCTASSSTDHHHEVIMGYGSPLEDRTLDITYKDIAGVAITRGFHTDNDHKWLYKEMVDGKYKMICSICNGVKWIDSFAGYSYGVNYFLYGQCYNNHALSSGNMMAVACYGDKDYYKCKYCRYVAPFDATVTQNYSITAVDSTYHQYTNQVAGLNYTIVEEHDVNPDGCYTCGYGHTHSYSAKYVYHDSATHVKTCACGSFISQNHSVKRSEIRNERYAKCTGCGQLLDLQKDQAAIEQSYRVMVSLNGSYILPNGIVVLEEQDVDAYMNGTLQFYPINDLPQTQ